MTKLKVIQSDIATLKIDAIVNAANKYLLGGGGVDGAIHRAAGPELLEECRGLEGCEIGEAKITKGYDLPVKNIIHTVGPIYGQADGREDELLASCYSESLELAKNNNLRTIAFPCISTGVFGFPKDKAAEIATKVAFEYIEKYPQDFDEIIFAVFDQNNLEIYRDLLAKNS